jgi:hypothetical protein
MTRGRFAVMTLGNYRQNAARELERFAEWAAGDQGDDWTGIVLDDVDREPTFEDLDECVFREYARQAWTSEQRAVLTRSRRSSTPTDDTPYSTSPTPTQTTPPTPRTPGVAIHP